MQYVKVLLAEEGEEPGATGIQPVTEVIYLKMLNAGVHPVIPERGSVSEVDVTCLPHKGLAMLGEGKYTIKVSEFCIWSVGEVRIGAGVLGPKYIPYSTKKITEYLKVSYGKIVCKLQISELYVWKAINGELI